MLSWKRLAAPDLVSFHQALGLKHRHSPESRDEKSLPGLSGHEHGNFWTPVHVQTSQLGYLDSNQEQKNQNLPCCQLHHTPQGRGLAGPTVEFSLLGA